MKMSQLKVFVDLPKGAIQAFKDTAGDFTLGIIFDFRDKETLSGQVLIW